MPDYRITDPDNGDVVVITGDRQPTRKEALKAFGMMRQQRSEQQVAGMTGDDLSEVVYGNPAVEYPDHVLRKLYDHEQTRSTDWWKVAKGLPGAAGRAVKDLAVNTGTAVFQEAPELISQAFNDPAKAAGTAVNTFAEFGARQVEELKMLPPVYAVQLDMLNRKIKSFEDYHSKPLAEYKRDREKRYQARTLRERPVDVTGKLNVEQENPTLYKQLKKDYDQFRADEQFKNWKQIFHQRQADSLKAAEVQSGKTSYVAEAAGGKEALEALTGSSEVMGSGAQVATDMFGLDILSAAPIGKIGGKALGTTGKLDNLATRAGKAVSKGVDKFAAGTERVTKALADAGGDNIVLRLSLSTPSATAITASQFTDTLARLAEVAAGGSVSRAARKARTRSARGILGASDNAFIEGMLQRVGQGLDEAIPAAGRGAAIGTLMGLGSVNDQQLAESIGGQAGFGGALGGLTGGGLGFTKIQQFNKANELLAKMDPDVREDFMASRLTALQGEANPQAAFIDEMAAISYINEDLAPDGVRVTVATPEQIVQMMRDQGRDEAFAVDAAQQQGVTFQNPVNNQTMVVVNSEYAQHMGKTAIHEVFHSFDHHDGEVDKNGFVDRIRAAWNEETPETGTVKGERIRLMTEAFGLFDETGRQLQEGELAQQQGEDAIDAYLSRRHGGDQSKVRADKMIDGRPMSYQELVNAYGDEVFARISEDFGTGNPIKNIRPGMIFSAVRNRLSRLREYVLRATGGKTDVAQVDALEKAAGNPMLQSIAREFWRTRKALKTATFKDSSKLTVAVTPKKLTRGKNAVANVNRYAGTGMFRTNADGKVLAENGEVFSAKPGERVAIIPQAERNKMAKRAVEAINATLDSLGEQDDGMFPGKTTKPSWVGIPNEAQLAAILALPDSTVPRILKQRIEKVVKAAREGDTLGVDHSKALTGRKYDTLAEMEYRLVAPFGFRITQAGNFLAMLFDIGKLNEKVDTRFKNKPKWFSEWADDTDPTGREGFYRTLREALERQRRGIKNNRDNTVGYDKILQLLNIDRLDADVGGSPTGLIRSFRVDRMNEIQTAEPKGFRIDWPRYKNPATFKPNPQEVKAQPSEADYMRAVESGDMETAQRMVDEAATNAGYLVGKVFHGTKRKFNAFKSERDTTKLIYFATGRKFAEEYARGYGGHRNPEPDIQARIDAAREASKDFVEQSLKDDLPQKDVERIFEEEKAMQRRMLDGMTVSQAQMGMGIRVIDAHLKADKIFDPRKNWREFENEVLDGLVGKGETLSPQMLNYIETGNYLVWERPHLIDAVFKKYDAIVLDEYGGSRTDSSFQDEPVTIAVRDPSRIKSADPVTYDDAGNVIPLSERFNESSDDIRFQPKPRKGKILRTVDDNTRLPLILRGALKGSLQKNVLDNDPQRLYERLDTANTKIQDDPSRFTNEKGFVEYFNDAGVHGNILHPPGGLDMMINRPGMYADMVQGGYHEGRTASGTVEAAMSGLDGVTEMRDVIGDKPSEWVSAMHHFWGILSRQLPPLQQEAIWLRLISRPEVLGQIQKSIDGSFDLTADQWKSIVSASMKETAMGSEKMGNQGTSNANAFYLMLKRWNGKWGEVADVYDRRNDSIASGRKFWGLGHGPVGIKNKVQRFIGLTFGTPAVIMDRWKFVEFWLPDAMKVKGASKPSEYFKYSRNTPEDPLGVYGAYGAAEAQNPAYSLALYEALETALQSAIDENPELQKLLGRHAHIGGAHWVGWNAIKNEAVGHSSLDITKELSKIKDLNDSKVYETVQKSSPYTEGLSGTSEIIRFTLDRGRPTVSRRSVSGR